MIRLLRHQIIKAGIIVCVILFRATNSIGAADTPIFFLEAQPEYAILNDDIPRPFRFRNESYVLPLSREEDIQHARYLIRQGPLARYHSDRPAAVATIAPGSNGINRNYLVAGFPEWSWHVTEFGGFGDAVGATIDGNPQNVEDDVEKWMANTSGLIGFTTYTVIKELGSLPLWVNQTNIAGSLEISWSGLGTNYVYTLESKSLSNGNWSPVEGGVWPTRAHQWTIPKFDSVARIFRVRANSQKP